MQVDTFCANVLKLLTRDNVLIYTEDSEGTFSAVFPVAQLTASAVVIRSILTDHHDSLVIYRSKTRDNNEPLYILLYASDCKLVTSTETNTDQAPWHITHLEDKLRNASNAHVYSMLVPNVSKLTQVAFTSRLSEFHIDTAKRSSTHMRRHTMTVGITNTNERKHRSGSKVMEKLENFGKKQQQQQKSNSLRTHKPLHGRARTFSTWRHLPCELTSETKETLRDLYGRVSSFQDQDPLNWMIVAVQHGVVGVVNSGAGSVEEMSTHLRGDLSCLILLRVPIGRWEKNVGVVYIADITPITTKPPLEQATDVVPAVLTESEQAARDSAAFMQNLQNIKRLFTNLHLNLQMHGISELANLTSEYITQKLFHFVENEKMLLRVYYEDTQQSQSGGGDQDTTVVNDDDVKKNSTKVQVLLVDNNISVHGLKQELASVFAIPIEQQLLALKTSALEKSYKKVTATVTLLEVDDKLLMRDYSIRSGERLYLTQLTLNDLKLGRAESSTTAFNKAANAIASQLKAARRHEINISKLKTKISVHDSTTTSLPDSLEKELKRTSLTKKRKIATTTIEEEGVLDDDADVQALVSSTVAAAQVNAASAVAVKKNEHEVVPSHDDASASTAAAQDDDASSDQDEYEIDYENLVILQKDVARGKTATLHKMLYNGIAEVACKEYWNKQLNPEISKMFHEEISLLRKFDHENVVQLIGYCSADQAKLCVVMEWIPRGALRVVLLDKSVKLTLADCVYMALDIARGMAYLHSIHIIHRDLKSHNLLVDEDWVVKITDFGTAKIISENDAKHFTVLGTSGWTAPEILYLQEGEDEKGYTHKCDVFSYGICVWELLTRGASNPLSGIREHVCYDKVKNGEMPPLPAWTPPKLKQFIDACWAFDAATRPEFTVLVEQLEAMIADPDFTAWGEVDVPVLYNPYGY